MPAALETSLRRTMAAAAAGANRAEPADRRRYAVAATLVASGIAHLGVQAVAGGAWDGPVSWRKPATFGLAFGVTLATLTAVTRLVPVSPRRRARLLTAFAVACVGEVAVITTQAWRGVPSHFNVSTPVNGAFAYTAAAGGAVLIGTTLAFAVPALRGDPAAAPSVRLGVRAGFISFLTALGFGAAMIAIGVRAGRVVSQDAAYTAARHLVAGHAATMHGILVLPGIAWLATRTDWPEDERLRRVRLACAGYLVAAGAVVVESVAGLDPVTAGPATAVGGAVTLAGLVLVAAVAAGTVRAALRPTVRPTSGARPAASPSPATPSPLRP
ncbi:MAG: hypothetical protein JWM67_1986 [Mycobacterium sp.]|jgi:hypothetical protein|nr:hypothetical protein [Mycobacterium sp.]